MNSSPSEEVKSIRFAVLAKSSVPLLDQAIILQVCQILDEDVDTEDRVSRWAQWRVYAVASARCEVKYHAIHCYEY
jgi:hypothetical protein